MVTILFKACFFIAIYVSSSSAQNDIESEKCYANICWDDTNYPAEEILSKLLEYNMKNINTFGEHEADNITIFDETPCGLCLHKTNLRISPVTYHDADQVYYVVRTAKYQQHITLNICESYDVQQKQSKCMENEEILLQKMSCSQKYIKIKLLVYDHINKKFTDKALIYPSACVCARNME